MYLKIRGLVIRATQYNDTDLLLTLLTAQYGKITAKARGARRKNSKLIAPSQLLAYCEYTLFEYRGIYTVNEADPIELFTPLHRDLDKLSLATYFVQAAETVSQEDMSTPGLLPLVLNSLYALGKEDASHQQIKAVFELRIACLAGYEPDLRGCSVCGKENPDRFDVSQGALICSTCRDVAQTGIRLPLSLGMLDTMRYICSCDPKRLFSFRLSDENLQALSYLTESYLSTQLERGFSALDFYKTLSVEQGKIHND